MNSIVRVGDGDELYGKQWNLPLHFKVFIDAVKCISKSKNKQNSGQKTNNDIYKILHRKLKIEKH
jgi:hypothetical protein